NIPFKTINIKFKIWNEDMLKSQNEMLKEGGDVEITYHYKDKFPQLDSMEAASIDSCPVCYSNLPAIDAQRWECQGCSTMNEEQHKLRINKGMKLTAKSVKNYRYGPGYHLNFLDEESDQVLDVTPPRGPALGNVTSAWLR
ncbi:MAG: hypothetical protein GY774_20510, partial [Planctomycetes bacterium]|nr:hypothetical protein [Planctomycetota bacterium]